MKLIRVTTIFALLFIVSVQTYAKSFRIKGGLNMATIMDKDNDGTYNDEYDQNVGLHFGFGLDLPISSSFSIEPGVLIIKKGTKYNTDYSGVDITTNMNINYLELPINFKLLLPLSSDDNKFYLSAGPYLAYALSAKFKFKATYEGEEETDEEKINIGTDKDNDMIRPFDTGITLGAGIELNKVTFGLSYDLGLYNIATDDSNGQTINNRVFLLSIAIKL